MANVMLLESVYVVFRLMPLLVIAPFEFMRNVPVMVRIVVTIALAFTIAGVNFGGGASAVGSLIPADSISIGVLITEFLIGMSLALSFHAVSGAVHLVGQLLDMQLGFIAGTAFDPSTEQLTGLVNKLLGMVLAVFFVASGFHYEVLLAVKALYTHVPTGTTFALQSDWYTVFARIFAFGFVFASPVVIILFLVDITLAVISRSLPQAQVYFVGLPLKVGVGLIALSWLINHAAAPLLELFMKGLYAWDDILRA